jgi:hypothetical protein
MLRARLAKYTGIRNIRGAIGGGRESGTDEDDEGRDASDSGRDHRGRQGTNTEK